MRKRIAGGAAALALGLAIGAPVRAIESMEGTYTGKLSCKGYAGGAPTKSKSDVTIDVHQSDFPEAVVRRGGTPLGGTVLLYVAADTAKLDRAKVEGVDCGTDQSANQHLVLQADAVVKPGSDKGTLKGTLIRRDAGAPALIEVCSFSVKRTSTAEPVITPCPPPG